MFRLLILVGLLLCSSFAYSAEEDGFKPNGRVVGRLYANAHFGLTEGESDDKAIEVTRAFLGYEYNLSPSYYAKVLLDIGSPDDASNYSKISRYAYFRNAFLRYKYEDLVVDFGLVPLYQFKTSEKYWGHRYIDQSFQDKYKFGTTADLGVTATYKMDRVVADISITNGEGYKGLQADDHFQYSLGLNFKITDDILARFYYDIQTADNVAEQSIHGFIGYKYRNLLVLGAEYNYKLDEDDIEGQDRYGYSFVGSYNFTEKWQLFARYDAVNSSIVDGSDRPWDLADDGSAAYAGVQFKPLKAISFSLNYQDWVPYARNQDKERYLYMNISVDF